MPQIPGGPKLARTPVGRTPATAYLAGPGSAVAQHYPGSGRMVQFAAGPGSASVGCYPGSAVALHRGGMTPQGMPPPMTFQVRALPLLAPAWQCPNRKRWPVPMTSSSVRMAALNQPLISAAIPPPPRALCPHLSCRTLPS